MHCKTTIHHNFVAMISSMCKKVDSLGLQYVQKENEERATYIKDCYDTQHTTILPDDKYRNYLISLWNDPTIQQVFVNHRSEFLETCDYYFQNFQRLSKDFVPNSADVSRATLKTAGMNASQMKILKREIRLVDCGGQVGTL